MQPLRAEEKIQNRFKEADADKARADLYDTEYWACVCFGSREQLEEFLELIGMNPDHKFIDGQDFAEAIKVQIQKSGIKWPARTSSTLSAKDIDELAIPLPVGR